MVSINRFEGKDRRRERRRATLQEVRKPYYERVVPDRKRKHLNQEDEAYYDELDPEDFNP
jgi:ribosome-binding protein aMBF1 (putative translation factor)